jgi:arylsulfatase A-like enzyme
MAMFSHPTRGLSARGAALAVALPAAVAAAFLLSGPVSPGGSAVAQDPAGPGGSQPNVVVVMTDDQEERSLAEMGIVQDRIAEQGVTFNNSFSTFPLCCPSRATFLTGQYAHNHGVRSNTKPGGFFAFRGREDQETLPVWLDEAGYRTAWVGKYLNGYDQTKRRYIPPGWNQWFAPVDQTAAHMFNYTLNENGHFRRYGDSRSAYQTDVYARKAVRFIGQEAPKSRPFFLTLSTLAPHGEEHRKGVLPNPRPAPRHERRFEGVPLPDPPSFNEGDVSDKPYFVGRKLNREERGQLRERYQDRLASLLAVDEAVGAIVRELNDAGELENTLIVFTSDNGYLLGEHRLVRKHWLYEESTQVPTVMRGPGIPDGETRAELVANIDLAPTILDAAGARSSGRQVDGLSLLPLAGDPGAAIERDILFENNLGSTAIRTHKYMYAEHQREDRPLQRELYDLEADRSQLESLHDDHAYDDVQSDLAGRLDGLRDCAGAEDCR